MTSDSQKAVDIAVAGRFHAFHLATELAKLSRLRNLYTAHRQLNAPSCVPNAAYVNRLDLAAWTVASHFIPLGYSGERKSEIFGNWLMRRLARKPPGILHSWNGNSLTTFRALKGSGWLLCVERSCPHNKFQYDLLVDEGNAIGIPHVQDTIALERAIEELHLADIIVAPSTYSARSYTGTPLVSKVRVNPLGGNVRYFERARKQRGLRVLMVGNNFLRKGTHYLIEAFQRIRDADAELWIRGEVPANYQKRIRDSRIKIIPPLPSDRLRELYLAADVFVQPSIDEGFGMTVLEALGYGLPLVVTENVGAADLLSPKVSLKVPIRDSISLSHAIIAARDLPSDGFDQARKQLLQKHTWASCVRRMVDYVYQENVSSTDNGLSGGEGPKRDYSSLA